MMMKILAVAVIYGDMGWFHMANRACMLNVCSTRPACFTFKDATLVDFTVEQILVPNTS